LYNVADDCESLSNIVYIVSPGLRGTPPKKQFLRTLAFIEYLVEKYGKYLSYSIGSAYPIDKTPAELLAWLKQQWETGKYEAIDYGVWFELDESVIPLEYKPALDVKLTKPTGMWEGVLA
jgi:hypothetical protein